jgi:hypothetical protein
VFTYAIDVATGRLRESARQVVGDAHTLGGEPQGNHVYLACGGDTDVFYRGTWTAGLTAHFVQPDGRLEGRGASDLCLAAALDSAHPLVAVRGFVLASALVGYDTTVSIDPQGRLAVVETLDGGGGTMAVTQPQVRASTEAATG